MDFFLNFLKTQIYTLSFEQAFTVFALICATIFLTLKYATKLKLTKFLEKIFGSDSSAVNEDIRQINERLDKLLSSDAFTKILEDVKLQEHIEKSSDFEDAFNKDFNMIKEKVDEITDVKLRIAMQYKTIQNELTEIRRSFNETAAHRTDLFESLKNDFVRMREVNQHQLRIIENIEEHTKSFSPEMRSFQRDILDNIKTIDKTVALIELTVRTQVNTSSVNLR